MYDIIKQLSADWSYFPQEIVSIPGVGAAYVSVNNLQSQGSTINVLYSMYKHKDQTLFFWDHKLATGKVHSWFSSTAEVEEN